MTKNALFGKFVSRKNYIVSQREKTKICSLRKMISLEARFREQLMKLTTEATKKAISELHMS